MEPLHAIIGTGVAIVGGLGTGVTVGIWLARRELKRVFDVVDRMPPPEWFARVDGRVDVIDVKALKELFSEVRKNTVSTAANETAIRGLQRETEDHEERIRQIERRR